MRLLKHLFAPSSARLFPEDTLHAITDAIAAGERGHTGELCFAVEPALHWRAVMAGVDARTRAGEVFAQLRVWDTAANNGVLIYLLLADRRIEVLADRGLAQLVPDSQWRALVAELSQALRDQSVEDGLMQAIAQVCELLRMHHPAPPQVRRANELPNSIMLI